MEVSCSQLLSDAMASRCQVQYEKPTDRAIYIIFTHTFILFLVYLDSSTAISSNKIRAGIMPSRKSKKIQFLCFSLNIYDIENIFYKFQINRMQKLTEL